MKDRTRRMLACAALLASLAGAAPLTVSADDGGGMIGSGTRAENCGGMLGSGTCVTTSDDGGGGTIGSGTRSDGGYFGSGH